MTEDIEQRISTIVWRGTMSKPSKPGHGFLALWLALIILGTASTAAAVAEEPGVRLFEFAEGDADLLEGLLPNDDIRAVSTGAPAPGLNFKVMLGNPELGLGHHWVIAQLITDQTCNAQGECEIHVLHASPKGWVKTAEVIAVDVAWLDDGSEPAALLFSGMQGPAIWRWDGKAYAFDRIGDDAIADAYYAATGGSN